MNRANIQELHDTLANLVNGQRWRFSMGQWLRIFDANNTSVELTTDPFKCGAVGCMAGWSVMLALNARDPNLDPFTGLMMSNWVEETARRWLGLTEGQADYWFYGDWARTSLGEQELIHEITLEAAVAFLAEVLASLPEPELDSEPEPELKLQVRELELA